MIREEEIVEIGKFQKTHALKGELNTLLDVDPEYLTDGNPLIVEIDGIYVPFYAESVRPKGASSYLVCLRGISNVEEATGMVNKTIYGLKKDMLEYFDTPEEEVVFDSDLVGYTVTDAHHGMIGIVERIDDSTVNTLMVVKRSDNNEVYIPYNEDFIDTINPDTREIFTDLPEGLVELNDKSDKQ